MKSKGKEINRGKVRSPKRNVVGHNCWSNCHGWARRIGHSEACVCPFPLVLFCTCSFFCFCLLKYWHYGSELCGVRICPYCFHSYYTVVDTYAFSEFQDGHQTFSPDRHNLTHYTHPMMVQPNIQQQINKRKSPGAYRGQEKKEKKMNIEMSLRVMYAINPSGRSMEGCTNGRASLWTCAPITGSPRSSRASGLGFWWVLFLFVFFIFVKWGMWARRQNTGVCLDWQARHACRFWE